RPYVWCSVADRTPRDLAGFDAIRFQARGEDVYRVTVQLRDVRPGASVEDTEWWASSFKTSPEWRDVVVPFEKLRSISETTDGRLDLGETRGLFFVLDAGNMRPGTAGVIEVRGLEFCAAER
ncbi:MAG: carbohydrate binding domain-containing protein, partial [Vicinamibacteria bacterium]